MRWWKHRTGQIDPQPDAGATGDELLSAFLDGQLVADEVSALTSELAIDAELRAAFEGLREVKVALSALDEVPAPRAFTLAASPAQAPQGLSRLELGTRFGAVAAAVAFVLILGSDLRGGPVEPTVATGIASSSSQTANSTRAQSVSVPPSATTAEADSAGASVFSSSATPELQVATPTNVLPLPSSTAPPSSTQLAGDQQAPEGRAAATVLASMTGEMAATAQPAVSAPAAALTPASTGATGATPSGTAAAAQRLTESEQESLPSEGPGTGTPAGAGPGIPTVQALVAPAVPDTATAIEAVATPGLAPGSGSGGTEGLGLTDRVSNPAMPALEPDRIQANAGPEWRVTVERRTDFDALRTAEVGLAGIAVALGVAAGWLRYARRRAGANT